MASLTASINLTPVVASSTVALGEGVRDDHAGRIDTQMQLLPASRATASMFRSRPFPFADNRQARAIDDEMTAGAT